MRQADLDNMRDHVREGDEPWNTAFSAFAADTQSSKNPRIYYEQGNYIFVHIQGPWHYTDPNGRYWDNPSDYVGTRANTDAETAFKQAIMWYITGNDIYRSNAMYIIRSYSAIETAVKHRNFRFATMTYLLAVAAEILRYSDTQTESLKWTDADTQNLTNAMNIVTVTYDTHSYFMNQHQFNVMGTIGRAIFTNNLELYAEAVEAATVNAAGQQGGRNGSIKYQMRYMTANELTGEPLSPSDYHVQLMEMGRDVGHSHADVAGLYTLALTCTYMFLTPKTGTNGKIRFAIKNNGSSEQMIDGQSALPTGGWHHVAVTMNGATGTLYVDGVQVGSNSAITIKPSDMGATTQNWIGRSQFSADPYLNGRVDNFRIYNKALTASEIAALAAST